MKAIELRNRLNSLGFELIQGKSENFFMVTNVKSGDNVADFYSIKESKHYKDFYLNKEFLKLGADTQAQLLNLLEVYTKTPLNEREAH
ncbi:hypothetical protein DUK53_13070 [Listeria sp. SHR_NRA_18]|uniref:hypothetical protein n=1 Tax=Listeria TaxID=1637 RepID=UPI000669F2E9|nr:MULTISPECIES: hypothetical protein [Listeria]KMT62528.1 hypothetical protein X559_1066 [Listeria newyorkensis]RQW65986.1 hypothetical protein DUK53_13070 [Listeria sp. SHR_NRA_18]